jgi:hypothetical protein
MYESHIMSRPYYPMLVSSFEFGSWYQPNTCEKEEDKEEDSGPVYCYKKPDTPDTPDRSFLLDAVRELRDASDSSPPILRDCYNVLLQSISETAR